MTTIYNVTFNQTEFDEVRAMIEAGEKVALELIEDTQNSFLLQEIMTLQLELCRSILKALSEAKTSFVVIYEEELT